MKEWRIVYSWYPEMKSGDFFPEALIDAATKEEAEEKFRDHCGAKVYILVIDEVIK